MRDSGGAGRASRRRLQQRRLTRRVFWDLAIYMVGLGLLVGAIFPVFAMMLGVPAEQARRPSFISACLLAGFLVGALNHGLSRIVVGRRLAVLSARLRTVADTITRASLTGEWSVSTSDSSRIVVDSDDELGETADAFNSLLDALAAGEHSRSLVHNSSDIITVIDRQGCVLYQTPSISWVLGLPPASLIGRQIHELVHPEDALAFTEYLSSVAESTSLQPSPVGVRMRHRSRSWRHMEMAGNNLLNDPVVNGIVLTTRDVSDRRELEDRLRHQAFHDSLTGLPNRALFLERVRHAEGEGTAAGSSVAVLFIDLDNLKVINDTLGHEGGDALIAAVGARLRTRTRGGDIAARLGGDEFALLLVRDETASQAKAVAERLLAELTQPVLIGERTVRPGVSIGVATSGLLDGTKDLVNAADAAMYVAKKGGKGRVEVFQRHHHAAEMARQQLRTDLQQALEEQQLVLHYQPIVDLVTGRIASFEALLRWHHPTRGIIRPGDFVPLAEETDLILSIGRWVLREACQHARAWQRSGSLGAGVKVSVNISARQFHDSGLVAEIKGALAAARLDPHLLTVELTETLLLQDTVVTAKRVAGLRELGVALALDDFGTGYSSLSYLRRLPINILKVDKSFLDEVPGNVQDEAVVRAIVELGTTLDLQLVAEGIETAEQATALASLGCPFGQGFYFARPVPFQEALGMVGEPVLPVQRSRSTVDSDALAAAVPARRYGT